MKLTQIVGSRKKEFVVINETELVIKEKYLLSSKEKTIHIEHIGHQKTIQTHSRIGVNIIGGFFMALAITSWITSIFTENPNGEIDVLIWGGLFMFVLGFICFIAPMNNILTVSGGNVYLEFFLDAPSKNEVEIFVDSLIKLSKEKIKKKYSRIDIDLPEETFMNQINWLLNNNIINEEEYYKKKAEYKIFKLTR